MRYCTAPQKLTEPAGAVEQRGSPESDTTKTRGGPKQSRQAWGSNREREPVREARAGDSPIHGPSGPTSRAHSRPNNAPYGPNPQTYRQSENGGRHRLDRHAADHDAQSGCLPKRCRGSSQQESCGGGARQRTRWLRCSVADFVDPATAGFVEPASHTAGGSPLSTVRKRREARLSRAEPLARKLGGSPLIKTTSVGGTERPFPCCTSPRRPEEDCKRPRHGAESERPHTTVTVANGQCPPPAMARHRAGRRGERQRTAAGSSRLDETLATKWPNDD